VLVLFGIGIYAASWTRAAFENGPLGVASVIFPLLWVAAVALLGTFSAIHHRKPILVVLAPFAVLYVLLAYAVWLVHGIKGLLTGKEPQRDKPTRYRHVVEST